MPNDILKVDFQISDTKGLRRIFLCAGEASGDAYAFAIAQRMLEAAPDVQLEGVGGAKLLSLIGKLVDNSSAYGAIGIYESIRVAHKVYGGLRKAKKNLRQGTPGVFIPIDFGFINIQLAKYAKNLGWKVIYFVPPGSWRRTKQGADLPAITDAIITPFSWSAEILKGMGANVFWEGHPLKQLIGFVPPPDNRESVAILPGSRLHEIQYNLAVIGESLAGFTGPVEIAVANTVTVEEMQKSWASMIAATSPNATPNIANPTFTQGDTHGVLKRGRAAIVCSGTATLESALCLCPCVVMYRVSKMMEMEYRLRKPKYDFISLPNILLNRMVLPELIQYQAVPETIGPLLQGLLNDPERQVQLDAFAELGAVLGDGDPIGKTVELALN